MPLVPDIVAKLTPKNKFSSKVSYKIAGDSEIPTNKYHLRNKM
jgi:hypothetical protein